MLTTSQSLLTSISLLEQVSAARLNILWKPETRRVEAVLAAIYCLDVQQYGTWM